MKKSIRIPKSASLQIQIPSEYIEYVEDLTEGLRTSQSNMVTWLLEQGIAIHYYSQKNSDLGAFCRCIKLMDSSSDKRVKNPVFDIAYRQIVMMRRWVPVEENKGKNDPWFVVRMPALLKIIIENIASEQKITKSKVVRELLRTALNMHAIVGVLMQDKRSDVSATGVKYYEAIRDIWVKDVTGRGKDARITLQIGRAEPFDVSVGRRVENPDFKKKQVILKEVMING